MGVRRGSRGGGGGMANPMTAQGDLIAGGAAGAPQRLIVGSEGDALTVLGGEPAWTPLSIPALSSATPQPLGVAAAGTSGDAARADHVHALPSTAVDLSVSTGWTSSLSGAGTAAAVDTADQQIELSVPGSLGGFGSATLYRDDTLLDGNADEVRCRIRSAALDNNTNDLISLIFITASDTNPVTLRVRGDSTVLAIDPSAGTAVTVTNILGGQGWLRLVRRGTESVMYAGVGSAGAPPTTWTPIGTSRSTSTTLPPIRRLRFDLVRLVSGTVAAHAYIGDISLRAPL